MCCIKIGTAKFGPIVTKRRSRVVVDNDVSRAENLPYRYRVKLFSCYTSAPWTDTQPCVIPLKTTAHPLTVPHSGWGAATKLHLDHHTKFIVEHEERGSLFNSQTVLYLDDLTHQAGFNSIHSNLQTVFAASPCFTSLVRLLTGRYV